MLFSSIPFLFWFLPGVLILYAAAPGSLKNTVLLLSSLFFYGWGEPRYVIWMMLAILIADRTLPEYPEACQAFSRTFGFIQPSHAWLF